ncbi:MAG: DUF308 domain-containing protein [Legionellales bacterium]|jgi:uncharacterized membrane protein HdeD (DUF308 family)
MAHPLSNRWGWFFAWGLLLVALGTLAIIYSAATTLISVFVFGVILTISGFVIILDSFKSSWGTWNEFFMHLGMGILYLIAGIILIKGPLAGSITLTLILAILYIVLGIFRIVSCLTREVTNRGWRLASSILTLLLGIFILAEWPMSGLFIIGLFIGIDLIFTGWIYIVTALTARSMK